MCMHSPPLSALAASAKPLQHPCDDQRMLGTISADIMKELPTCSSSIQVFIIGAGPSGLATAACLRQQGVPHIIIERSPCIASLWRHHTYDRLHMHTGKNCCELPFAPLPESYPNFLARQQFIDYLEGYARKHGIQPNFNETVVSAKYDYESESWIVQTRPASPEASMDMLKEKEFKYPSSDKDVGDFKTYSCKSLVVATGENAEAVWPQLPGLSEFKGSIIHSSQYKNSSQFQDKNVLIVGAGNSGMEIALDLTSGGATSTSIVVRSPFHILPREMFGLSTYSLGMNLCKVLPVRMVDRILVTYSQLRFGDTLLYGIRRPKIGPLELKNTMGKTPILDVGTLSKIQSGKIKVKPAIECMTVSGVRFVDNSIEEYDALILATGYRSNVPSWLHDEDQFFTEQGLSRSTWKGKRGLYAAGLSGRGLLRAIHDARSIAHDIATSKLTS